MISHPWASQVFSSERPARSSSLPLEHLSFSNEAFVTILTRLIYNQCSFEPPVMNYTRPTSGLRSFLGLRRKIRKGVG